MGIDTVVDAVTAASATAGLVAALVSSAASTVVLLCHIDDHLGGTVIDTCDDTFCSTDFIILFRVVAAIVIAAISDIAAVAAAAHGLCRHLHATCNVAAAISFQRG